MPKEYDGWVGSENRRYFLEYGLYYISRLNSNHQPILEYAQIVYYLDS